MEVGLGARVRPGASEADSTTGQLASHADSGGSPKPVLALLPRFASVSDHKCCCDRVSCGSPKHELSSTGTVPGVLSIHIATRLPQAQPQGAGW